MRFRKGEQEDIAQLRSLALNAWAQFKNDLTAENWDTLHQTLTSLDTYRKLIQNSEAIVCENDAQEIIGMVFLVPSGNPTDIYEDDWCHLRFVTVDPNYRGQQIGTLLTQKCIDLAKNNNEKTIALHTSEIMKSARKIYDKLGFKLHKEIDPQLGVCYWLYTLELAAK